MMRKAIALDLGGTQTRAAIVDEAGTVTNRVSLPTPAQEGGDAVVAQLAKAAEQAAEGVPDIIGAGVSSPGPLDTAKGITLELPTIGGMINYPIRANLEARLKRNVVLENDGIAAAIGEWKHGAGTGLQSIVYVTVSTGIGGGVIVDGHVLRGRMGMAGHVGHQAIYPDGLRCTCGNAGCWEAYAAGPAFAKRASQALGKTVQPTDVFTLAREGHAAAQNQVNEEARLLGIGITSLLHLYSPEKVIIGGGLSNALDQLHPGINSYVQANAMLAFRDVPVVKAELGGNSGLVGAASLVFASEEKNSP
jgi:glucokinase